MSLFQFGLGGGGPIGALLTGPTARSGACRWRMLLPAFAMMVLIAVVVARSRIWSMRTVE